MAKLVMLVGISGSGKSTVAKNAMEANPDKVVVVSSDGIRGEMFGDENVQKDPHKVFNEVHKRVREALKEDKIVYYDATNLNAKRRMNFLKTIEHLDAEKECIVVLSTPEECVERQSLRERRVPVSVINKQIKQFQCPYYYEGWDNIELLYNIFKEPVRLPDLMELNKIPHDNSHHEHDIYEHMKAAEHLYCNTVSIIDLGVAEAIKYHDLGKFFTKTFTNMKDEVTEEAHYYGHQNAGAYFYLLDYEHARKMPIVHLLRVANLIQFHMEPFFRKGEAWYKFAEMIGPIMATDIIKIHHIDVTSA